MGARRRYGVVIMKRLSGFLATVLMWLAGAAALANAAPAVLSLAGYVDDGGAISILHHGDTVDPYFALLAHENGLDISSHAEKWGEWMIARQKPDATVDRFCRGGPVWAPCKTTNADDALLALWLKFLDTMPARLQGRPAWRQSYQMSGAALRRLRDKRGIYLVSPVYQHGLFMDNLEVWS